MREAVTAEASKTTDLESSRGGKSSGSGSFASASASSSASATAASSSDKNRLRGVYTGPETDVRDSRSSRNDDSRRRKESSDESCSRSRTPTNGRGEDLTNSVRFKGRDLDSAFGPRVFGKPSVQRSTAPSVSSGNGNGNGNGNLRGTQIPSADVQIESNRALGFHLQPDVQLNRNEESACVSAEETHREGCTKGAKYRHFAIKGDICVSEKVTFKENSVEEEKTAGRAAKNTMAVETTDVGDILRGPQDCYTVTTRSPLEYTLGCGENGEVDLGRSLPTFPCVCQTDAQCKAVDENYVCGYPEKCYVENKFSSNDAKICIPRRGDECNYKKLSGNKSCEIDGIEGKCSYRDYCVPLACKNDDDCLHDGLYYCKRSKSEIKNGKKGYCVLKSEL